jgi:hypothetical protein
MTVLNLDECRKINTIVDYIVAHPAATVERVKSQFKLSNDEYDMISELMMPAVRWRAAARDFSQDLTRARCDLILKDEKIAELENKIAGRSLPNGYLAPEAV